MTERVKGASLQETLALFDRVHEMLTAVDYDGSADLEDLDKLAVLSGVREYPTRVKCASLSWHALKSALTSVDDKISTE
jgi:nitrogen fixation NifU-like protein